MTTRYHDYQTTWPTHLTWFLGSIDGSHHIHNSFVGEVVVHFNISQTGNMTKSALA